MPAGSKANVESQPCGRWICSFELPDDQPCREIPFEARGRLLRQQGGELKNSEQRCSGKRGNANGHGTSRLRIKFWRRAALRCRGEVLVRDCFDQRRWPAEAAADA